GPRGQQGPDSRPGLELRLRRRRPDRGELRLLPPPQDRQVGSAADPHGPRGRLRAETAENRGVKRLRPWRHWTVRTRIVVSVVSISAVALIAANFIAVLLLNWYLVQRVDQQLTGPGHNRQPAVGKRPEFSPGPDFQVFHFDSQGRLDPATTTDTP